MRRTWLRILNIIPRLSDNSKYIRVKEQVRTSVGPLRNSTGRVVSDESEMAGLLNRYFS